VAPQNVVIYRAQRFGVRERFFWFLAPAGQDPARTFEMLYEAYARDAFVRRSNRGREEV
jgi:hypothetical protein